MKKVVISCGPIPARLDSVKFITNRFKGGLAFKAAEHLYQSGYSLTLIVWEWTPLPDWADKAESSLNVVKVKDVYGYCTWFENNAKEYDAFIMAAAVANLAPTEPYEGKFPSHNYKVGDTFKVEFCIAPRAIDIVKKVNPRACLVGYKLFDAKTDEELIEIARHTLSDSKANVIFANTPKGAKDRKLAVLPDNSVIECTFDEHLKLIEQAIEGTYFKTKVEPLTDEEKRDVYIRKALAVVELYEKTFPGFGTVAVPVEFHRGMFATTSRGHKGEPVLVRRVDIPNRRVYASGKATLNAPTLAVVLKRRLGIVAHRHYDDPLAEKCDTGKSLTQYEFPGTIQEICEVARILEGDRECTRIDLPHHGYISVKQILPVDWERYAETFPKRYMVPNEKMEGVIKEYDGTETLELAGNTYATGKYTYDKFAKAKDSINLSWDEVMKLRFSLVFIRNGINYFPEYMLKQVLSRTHHFIANTFLEAPDIKVTDREVAVKCPREDGDVIQHVLRLDSDEIMVHEFHAYDKATWERLGLKVIPYGKNSALVVKNCHIE